jgi:succinate dehydrogenase / fumarate reductase membrane anchor subunit
LDGGAGEFGAHYNRVDCQLSLGKMKSRHNESMRSPLSRALGLGSAKSGVEQWWRERVSALALVPLTVWFAASIITHTGSDYVTFIAWLRTPIVSLLMVLLLTGIFYHAALGLQVVIEDYVHSALKTLALLGMRFSCCGLVVAGILAIMRIALSR